MIITSESFFKQDFLASPSEVLQILSFLESFAPAKIVNHLLRRNPIANGERDSLF